VLLEEGEADRAATLFEESLRTLEEMFDAGRGWPDRWLEAAAIHAMLGRHRRRRCNGCSAHSTRVLMFPACWPGTGASPRCAMIARFQEIIAQMADAQAAQRARVEAEGIAAEMDAMIAAGLGRAAPAGPAEARP
jgi:hypothetical protein